MTIVNQLHTCYLSTILNLIGSNYSAKNKAYTAENEPACY